MFKVSLTLLILVLMSPLAQAATNCGDVTEIPSTECEALIALYNSTDGANWENNTGWNVTNTPCSWHDVSCSDGHVSELYLGYNQLCGEIPAELKNLSSIRMPHNNWGSYYEYLKLNNNHLTAYDPELIKWLNDHNPSWKNTQTSCSTATLRFSSTTYSTIEDREATCTVTRVGNSDGAITVDYATTDYIAIAGSDYTQTTGTLTWADGDSTDKTITITIIDDSKLEGLETFTITLTDPVTSENLDNAAIIINDNDPIDCATVTEIPTTECDALIALYDSTNGANWENNTEWYVTTTPCSWYGITCDGGHITEIDLSINNLNGSIPAQLGNLSHLKSLDFGHYSPVSVAFQNWDDSCKGVWDDYWPCSDGPLGPDWKDNHLSGSIPPELGNLSNLEYLHLGVNQLSGPIPPELGNLSGLKSLSLHYNLLSGPIPPELGNLSGLESLSLKNNYLSGSIPAELGNLSGLESLPLNNNQLSGSIPAELGNLSLRYLNLGINQLSGSIPTELANLSSLRTLNLGGNQLSGSIPTELANMSGLGSLNLGGNQLSGSIPTELANMSGLGSLNLGGNQLSGSIPTELGNLSSLRTLNLGDNQLTGTIPTELANISGLYFLYLNNNQLTGEIPKELGNLTLWSLFLNNNHLTGSIPEELGYFGDFSGGAYYNGPLKINLKNNNLCGPLPLSLENHFLSGRLNFGIYITLDHNQPSCSGFFTTPTVKVAENAGTLTLTVHRVDGTLEIDYATTDDTALDGHDYIGTTGKLTWVDGDNSDKTLTLTIIDDGDLEDNETFTVTLTDPVSGENLDNTTIIIDDNESTNCATVTEIPSTECEALMALYNSTDGDNWESNGKWNVTNTPCDWSGVSCSGGHVLRLYLSDNSLTGSIPTELANLTNLTELYLSNNSLTGSIPTEMGNLSNLTRLDLGDNSLTGSIPTEMGNLTNLTELSLSDNSLTGSIPTEMGNLTNLTELSLSDNSLTGTIPTEMGNLTNLGSLYLGNNQLTGTIPTEIGNLSNLWTLDLGDNSLCGEIPVELKNLSISLSGYNSSSLKLDNNHLTASDSELIAWLDSRNPGWASSQTPCSSITTLLFSSATYNVTENGGQASITVTRTGNGAISANYATTDGTATAGSDYTQTTGTLSWASGDSADKTFTIAIIDDGKSEGDETFTITLTDPISGESLDSAIVTITDDDVTLVTLVEFIVMALEENEIIVEWQTATEFHNAGFHLWRATGESWKYGDYSTVIRLTEQLIAAQGNSSVYTYIDTDVESGITYYYGLEDIDLNGQSTFHWDLIDSATAR